MTISTQVRNQYKMQAQQKAGRLFEQASSRNWMRDVWAMVTGRSRRLITLAANTSHHIVAGRQTITISQIRGSNSHGKCADFDINFKPLKSHSRARWISVAVARQLGVSLPPVELVKCGDIFFVTDGHHRISVAKVLGHAEIEANVTVLAA